jgi:hypothetical protein
VGPRAVLDTEVKRKIPSPRWTVTIVGPKQVRYWQKIVTRRSFMNFSIQQELCLQGRHVASGLAAARNL